MKDADMQSRAYKDDGYVVYHNHSRSYYQLHLCIIIEMKQNIGVSISATQQLILHVTKTQNTVKTRIE